MEIEPLSKILGLMLCVILISGCFGQSDLRLGCEYHEGVSANIEGEWLANNITSWDELPNETKRNLTGVERNSTRRAFRVINYRSNMTRYSNLSDENRKLFIRLVERDSIPANRSVVSSFTQSEYPYEPRYIIYNNSIYVCGGGYPGE